MFPFVRPLNIHPPPTFSGGPMNFSKFKEPYINVPILKHDYEIYPEKKSDLAVCVIPANNKALQEYAITKDNIKKYAEKCGADLIELFGDVCPHWPLLNKYRLFFVTSKYKRTLFLDVDIIVNEDTPNIFEITPEDKFCIHDEMPSLLTSGINVNKHFFKLLKMVAKEFNLPLKQNPRAYNSGVMVIPNDLAKHFSQPLTNRIINEWTSEQAYMNLTIPDEDVFLLDSKFNHLFFDINFWENINDAYFIHVAGSGGSGYRLELMRRLLNKNYKPLLPPIGEGVQPKWMDKYAL